MIKIEHDAKNGDIHIEQQGTGLYIVGEFISLVHHYYTSIKEREPMLAEMLKFNFEKSMEKGIIFCDTKEACEKMDKLSGERKIRGLSDLLDDIIKDLEKIIEDKEEKKEDKPKKVEKKETKEKTTRRTETRKKD